MSEWFSTEVLLCIIILIAYIVGAEIIEIKRVEFIHESGVAIFLGIFAGIFIKYVVGTAVAFDEHSLFYFILPPIIFSAGYTLKRKNFINNFSYIFQFGVFGTFISMLVLSYLIIKINHWLFSDKNYYMFKLSDYEWLLLSAILWASDSVAALTIVKKKDYPKLNSILFGEGIINDAVSILIFRSIEDLISNSHVSGFNEPDKDQDLNIDTNLTRMLSAHIDLTFGDIIYTFWRFGVISCLSILIGVGFGLAASFICKNVPTLKIHPAREVFLILLVAYLAYVVSEMLALSGIMTIFWWGMVMSYYALYNLSNKSRKGSQLAVETLGDAAEAFLFTYMGLSLFSIEENHISIEFSFFVLFASFIARAFSIFIPYLISCKWLGLTDPLDFNQLLIIWFSGLVKGAIAFGMSLQISTSITNRKAYLVSSTLSIVMLSTIILGGLMSFFANMIGLSKEKEMLKRMYASIGQNAGNLTILEPEAIQESSESRVGIRGKLRSIKLTIHAYIQSIDELIMHPCFGGATEADEEREREEEVIEEEEVLRIFAEQHLTRYANASQFEPGEVEYIDKEEVKNDHNFGEFSYNRKSNGSLNFKKKSIGDATNIRDDFMDIEIKDIVNPIRTQGNGGNSEI